MMTIFLSDVSKRFNRDWIFRNFNFTFTIEHSYAIIGPNGSGKSTLLQVIGGAIGISEGEIIYRGRKPEPGVRRTPGEGRIANSDHSKNEEVSALANVSADDAYKYISFAAPYLEVIEEMTAVEFLNFHQVFKPLLPGCSIQQILTTVGLEKASNKQIRYYSSGMKQRIKLAQAIFSDTPVVLLDEPCTNLDAQGVELYHKLVAGYCRERLIIVSSNDVQEYGFCEERISILDYK